VTDANAVLDHLAIERLLVVGVSTGGAYALALAASSPRVIGAVACCAVSDMQWVEGKAMNVCCHGMWNARTHEEAVSVALTQFGEHGEKVVPPLGSPAADPSDAALFSSPDFLAWWIRYVPDMFAQGVAGFVEDRRADGNGWTTFDVSRIACPVTVLHGTSDGLMPVANAYHTASIVPGATLRIVENRGHLSVIPEAVDAASELLARCTAAR
jgi:pimeloyl-ACP methyl ester carboxylesterase